MISQTAGSHFTSLTSVGVLLVAKRRDSLLDNRRRRAVAPDSQNLEDEGAIRLVVAVRDQVVVHRVLDFPGTIL